MLQYLISLIQTFLEQVVPVLAMMAPELATAYYRYAKPFISNLHINVEFEKEGKNGKVSFKLYIKHDKYSKNDDKGKDGKDKNDKNSDDCERLLPFSGRVNIYTKKQKNITISENTLKVFSFLIAFRC